MKQATNLKFFVKSIYIHLFLIDHARREDREDCIIFHSLQAPTAVNITMERQGLDSMDKVFDYVSDFQFSFGFTK